MPTRYSDVAAIAYDVEQFSSRDPLVFEAGSTSDFGVSSITSDPPEHTWLRRLLLPWFSRARVATYEVFTRELCARLARVVAERGTGDAATEYAQQIPVRVVGKILGVSPDMSGTFSEWVRDALEFGTDPERRARGMNGFAGYLKEQIALRRSAPGDDMISVLTHTDVDGHRLGDEYVLGAAVLVLTAGMDTTWSAIGASLLHLATTPNDTKRLVREPELIPTAIEELLRAYSPVTMARIVNEDTEVGGCPIKAGDRVLLNFPAANRDPDEFPDADKVIIDRLQNRHIAFGLGIHRCAGSNLARMEMRVAVEEWLKVIPEFHLASSPALTWAGGQVRGPRSIPVVIG